MESNYGLYLTAKDLAKVFPRIGITRLNNIMCRSELSAFWGKGCPFSILFNEESHNLIVEINELYKRRVRKKYYKKVMKLD